ncbi:class I SAM-dependent methyltransferase [Phenylobacterium montanum]|uniref:Class I SAM-dependent methyltransferase n=2 Tax=Phenylobacterium montanum TaxID=2823693 RepID=A0A975G4Y8_9CAUL|nr:class I SAM-dependent methyltransferase [Caulobacter sp. S6]
MAAKNSLAAARPDLRRAPPAFQAAVKIAARHWTAGGITFVLPSGREIVLGGSEPGHHARVEIRDYNFMRRVLAAGDIGFAEGYMAGEWSTPDLTAVLASASQNWERLAKLVEGNAVMRVLNTLGHLVRPNTRRGARRNIHAHYDLGNAFYQCWLDPSMTYSSARFEQPGQSLTDAQRSKYASLARAMRLEHGHSVLEIGCGWGGFAEFAAREVGAKVTGVTISREQYDFARRRLFEQGLAERAEIRLVDYRDVEGRFDRVASIEMFEAVGERYWPAYFQKLHDVLEPGGLAGLQIITIRDELFDDYRSRADFIQKYVFPGGMLGCEARLREVAERANLAWGEVARFGQDYGLTLAEWRHRFHDAWDEIKGLGFDERFRRLWSFYLSYCEAGFKTGRTDVIQLSLSRA